MQVGRVRIDGSVDAGAARNLRLRCRGGADNLRYGQRFAHSLAACQVGEEDVSRGYIPLQVCERIRTVLLPVTGNEIVHARSPGRVGIRLYESNAIVIAV